MIWLKLVEIYLGSLYIRFAPKALQDPCYSSYSSPLLFCLHFLLYAQFIEAMRSTCAIFCGFIGLVSAIPFAGEKQERNLNTCTDNPVLNVLERFSATAFCSEFLTISTVTVTTSTTTTNVIPFVTSTTEVITDPLTETQTTTITAQVTSTLSVPGPTVTSTIIS